MKKQLLLAAFLMGSFITASAQEVTFDFNDYTVDNMGTDMTGTTAGQGGWLTFGNPGTPAYTWTNAAFQVVANDAEHVNALQITGANTASNGAAFLWQTLDWAGRTAGNDLVRVEFDVYTGAVEAASKNVFQVALYDETAAKILAGFFIDKTNLSVDGIVFATPQTGEDDNLLAPLVDGGLTVPANVWIKLVAIYNYADGTVAFGGFNADGTQLFAPAGFQGAAAQTAIGEVDFIVANGYAANTASASVLFDNLNVEFFGETAGVDAVTATKLSVFPNPASDVINVANVEGLNAIQIVDLNGRTVKSVNFAGVSEASVNVSDLTAGVYMMNIATEKGTSTQKIVKK